MDDRITKGIVLTCVFVMVLVGETVAQTATISGPPGMLADVGGYRLHVHCIGEGHPAVILDGGVGAWSIFYRDLQERIAQDTRVCTYDRAGLGWSEPGSLPRNSRRMAEELHTVLRRAGVPSPYVLVGHSLGGYNARLFAEHFRDDVAGLVLAESAHEEQWKRLPKEAGMLVEAAAQGYRAMAAAARRNELAAESISPWEGASGLESSYMAAMMRPATYETMAAEMEAATQSAQQVATTGNVGNLPLAVVSAANSFAAFEGTGIPVEAADSTWRIMQKELLDLSSASRWFVSEVGDHRIHRTDPDIVTQAIRYIVDEVRRKAERTR